MLTPLRDHREPRDLTHPWRDPPGFFRGNACDCHCSSAGTCCDETNKCGTLQFQDNSFSSLASYTESACGVGGKLFSGGSGTVTDTFGGAPGHYPNATGAIGQSVTIPTLNGLCISVSAVLYAIISKNTGTTGIYIGGVGVLLGRYSSPTPFATPYINRNTADAHGCFPGSGTNHTFGTANTNFTDGDCAQLVLQDTSSGGGTYSLKSYVNGTLMDTFTGLTYSLSAGGTLECGMIDSNGGKWGNFCIATS